MRRGQHTQHAQHGKARLRHSTAKRQEPGHKGDTKQRHGAPSTRAGGRPHQPVYSRRRVQGCTATGSKQLASSW